MGARFARPRGTGSMGISSLQKFPRGTGGMGDVSPIIRFVFHKRSSFVDPQYWGSIYQTSFLPL